MIANIAYIFGLSQKQYQSIKESRKSSDKLNPYIVLESQPTDDLQIIRKKYIKLSNYIILDNRKNLKMSSDNFTFVSLLKDLLLGNQYLKLQG